MSVGADPGADKFDDILAALRPKIEAGIAARLPRVFTEESIEQIFGKARYAYDVESASGVLLEPAWDMLDRGGKRWRPVLVLLVADALKGERDDPRVESAVLSCACLCELVHTGSLIADDVEDDSRLRRGKPCLHLTHGLDVAINTGNAMYFLPLRVMKQMRADGYDEATIAAAYEMYGEEMTRLHLGQGLDIWWHSGKALPSVDDYLQMCAYKTGTLARLSARLAALVCGAAPEQTEAFGHFAESVGVAFQIQDDLLNLEGDEFAQKIAIQGEDIYEGKRSLMAIHCLAHAAPEKAARLEQILNSSARDPALIQEALALMRETDSLLYARRVAKDLVSAAWRRIEPFLPNNSTAKKNLKLFSDYLITRDV